MHSNFYRSQLKKEIMRQCGRRGFDMMSFNNRGAEQDVANERFTDCLEDLDVLLKFARAKGYRHFVLLGHSTGCQKITYYQARRQRSDISALVELAPADDYAIWRHDLGSRYTWWVNKARQLVSQRRGDERLPPKCWSFSARRFLSVADPRQAEAKVFNYRGRLTHFRKIRCPVQVLFGSEEEFLPISFEEMEQALRDVTQANPFDFQVIPGADHGFHACERVTANTIFRWLQTVRVTG
jgi:pimeloyl-ACP methyl ester carboxylesterase